MKSNLIFSKSRNALYPEENITLVKFDCPRELFRVDVAQKTGFIILRNSVACRYLQRDNLSQTNCNKRKLFIKKYGTSHFQVFTMMNQLQRVWERPAFQVPAQLQSQGENSGRGDSALKELVVPQLIGHAPETTAAQVSEVRQLLVRKVIVGFHFERFVVFFSLSSRRTGSAILVRFKPLSSTLFGRSFQSSGGSWNSFYGLASP